MDQQEIDRGHIAEDYRNSIIASVKHDENSMHVSADRHLCEQYHERGRQLDENEACLKEQYVESGCEEQTGMTADAFRHQAISDYTRDQVTAQELDANDAQSYWGKSQSIEAEGGVSVASSDQYWNSADAVESDKCNVVVEDGKQESAVDECSAAADVGASADNSVSNENSV